MRKLKVPSAEGGFALDCADDIRTGKVVAHEEVKESLKA